LDETLVAWFLGSIGRNTSMCLSLSLACKKIGFGRSRVIPCCSRDIGCSLWFDYEILEYGRKEMDWRPGGNCLAVCVG